MNASDFRTCITKSRAGHYRVTLIHKATRIKVCGDHGWSSKESAIANEKPALVERLAVRVAMFQNA